MASLLETDMFAPLLHNLHPYMELFHCVNTDFFMNRPQSLLLCSINWNRTIFFLHLYVYTDMYKKHIYFGDLEMGHVLVGEEYMHGIQLYRY